MLLMGERIEILHHETLTAEAGLPQADAFEPKEGHAAGADSSCLNPEPSRQLS